MAKAKRDKAHKETQQTVAKLQAFHAVVGNVVWCDWDVFVVETGKLLGIHPAVLNAMRMVGFYGKCDGGWVFQP